MVSLKICHDYIFGFHRKADLKRHEIPALSKVISISLARSTSFMVNEDHCTSRLMVFEEQHHVHLCLKSLVLITTIIFGLNTAANLIRMTKQHFSTK